MQPQHPPQHLPQSSSTLPKPPSTEQHDSITISEAFNNKIEFVWDEENTCYEVGKKLPPHLMVRLPGKKRYEARKLEEFTQVRINNKTYYLEK